MGHLEGIWKAFGKHLENIWKAFGRHLEGIWKAFGRHLEGILELNSDFGPGGLFYGH